MSRIYQGDEHVRILTAIGSAALVLCLGGIAAAQFADSTEEQGGKGIKLGEGKTQQWKCGIELRAANGPCFNITGYVPFPIEWPEQSLKIISEDIAKEAKVSYETLDDSVKLMVIKMASVPAGADIKATVTFEITRKTILGPEDPTVYKLPDTKKLDRRVLQYLGPSPKIESTNSQIRKLAKEIGADQEVAWKRVEAIYDFVREKIKYENGPLKGAVAALRDGTGDCEEMTSLFIAICRAANIPARTVWVPGHCYPEFYLVDEDGKGYWFPCQAAGSRAFGEIPETRPILQKGDNFRPPWNKGDRQRYLSEHIAGSQSTKGRDPQVRFIRELVK